MDEMYTVVVCECVYNVYSVQQIIIKSCPVTLGAYVGKYVVIATTKYTTSQK